MKKIYYGRAVYNHKEINAVIDVLKKNSLSLTDGKKVKILEKKVSNLFGKKYGLMVNSGSSANLLALASLNFKKGSEIITPNLTFSTTVAPIYQLGLVASFIGVEKNKFVADVEQIEKCINKNTVAIMIPNLLGNIADWKKISQIAKKYSLKVIEDSADTIGYTYKMTQYRDKKLEKGILWDDKDLNIKWPIKKPIISNKDKSNLTFKEYIKLI